MATREIPSKREAEIDELVRATEAMQEAERRLTRPVPFGEVLRSTFRQMLRPEGVEHEQGRKSRKAGKA
ncbi:MAG: hypothetical protein JJU33_14790 [Phycisphaerales bacterium]|nr:hypothetical protein [Phycisphaerales bacterium]